MAKKLLQSASETMKIPVYDEPQVASQAIPDPGSSLNVNGYAQGMAQGLGNAQQASDHIAAVIKEEKSKANAAAAIDAETQFQGGKGGVNDAMHNPETGLMNKRGDALFPANSKQDLGQQTMDALSKRQADIAKGLDNDEQRQAFLLRTNGILQRTHEQIETHVAHQRQEAQQASMEGLKATSMDALAQNYNDPKLRALYIAQPEGAINALALSPEDRAAKIADWRSRAAGTVLNQYVANKDWEGAQRYFSQVKDQMGPNSAHFESIISDLKEKEQGNSTALGIVNAARKESGFVDDNKAVRDFESLPADKRNKHTEEAFQKYLSLEKTAQNNQIDSVYSSAFSSFLGSHSLSDVSPQDRVWLKKNAPQKWSELEGLQERWASRWKKEARTGDSHEETQGLIEAIDDINKNKDVYATMSPAEFQSRWSSRLSEKGYKEAGLAFARAKQHGDTSMPAPETAVVQRIFTQELGKNANPKKWDEDTTQLWSHVKDYVQSQRTEYIRAHKKEPPQEQVNAWAKDQLVKGSIPGSGTFFDDHVSRAEYETNPKYQGKEFQLDAPKGPELDTLKASLKADNLGYDSKNISDRQKLLKAIPDAATRRQLRTALQRQGKAVPSDDDVMRFYRFRGGK